MSCYLKKITHKPTEVTSTSMCYLYDNKLHWINWPFWAAEVDETTSHFHNRCDQALHTIPLQQWRRKWHKLSNILALIHVQHSVTRRHIKTNGRNKYILFKKMKQKWLRHPSMVAHLQQLRDNRQDFQIADVYGIISVGFLFVTNITQMQYCWQKGKNPTEHKQTSSLHFFLNREHKKLNRVHQHGNILISSISLSSSHF